MHELSWRDIDGMVSLLAGAMSRRRFDAIVGIARSGLVPAVMLSHTLSVRRFGVLDIQRTTSDEIESSKHSPVLKGELQLDGLRDCAVLLVDDIVGAGATMLSAREVMMPRCASLTTATLVVNQVNLGPRLPSAIVDHHACLVNGWVIFPWEGKR